MKNKYDTTWIARNAGRVYCKTHKIYYYLPIGKCPVCDRKRLKCKLMELAGLKGTIFDDSNTIMRFID